MFYLFDLYLIKNDNSRLKKEAILIIFIIHKGLIYFSPVELVNKNSAR